MTFRPGACLLLVLAVSCASYDPAADYRSRLTPFDAGGGPGTLSSRGFTVPEALVPGDRPPVPPGRTPARAEFLLDWMGSRTVFDGGSVPPFPLTAPNVWAASRDGRALNCLAASTLFAALAQGAGLSARVLWLYPRDLSNDNHVIVLVWDPDAGRWLAADPSYRTLFYGEDGPLGPGELRSRVAAGLPVTLSPGASWNGEPVDHGYLHYLSKNLYRWSAAGTGGRINLSPPDFPGWGPPWAWSASVRDPAAFLAPP